MPPSSTSPSQTASPPVQPDATAATAYGTPASGFLVLLLPLMLMLSVLSYRKYRKQRARDRAFTLLQQVARLEAMWHIKPPR